MADGSAVGFVGTLPSLGGLQEMTDVELIMVPFSGATETYISAIDNSGRIVGSWEDDSGVCCRYGYIATPVRKGRQ